MKRNVADLALIGIFTAVILFFAVGAWLAPADTVSVDENRALAKPPKLHLRQLDEFTSSLESFLNDRMVGRTLLVKSRNWLKYAAWGVSGSQNVAIGKQGWLYFLGDGSAPVIRHEKPFSQRELSCWKAALEQRTQYLAKRGIKYVFLAAPDKDTVYPEFLPTAWRPVHSQSRLDQLTETMKQAPSVAFLNVADVLKTRKGQQNLYYKTDTHWNELGAFIAYRQVAGTIGLWFPFVKPLDEMALQYGTKKYATGDCSKLLGLLGWLKEDSPSVAAQQQAKAAFPSTQKLGKAIVFHDSFGDGLKPFLSEHFEQIDYRKQDEPWIDLEDVARQKPDVVIQEMVERHVAQFVPSTTDWRTWVSKTIASNSKPNTTVWLNVMPSTADVTTRRFKQASIDGCTIKPTTCRTWSESGDTVTFDEKTATYCDWYLLKTGEQGNSLRDKNSEQSYTALSQFVRDGGAYVKVASHSEADGSQLTLYRKK